MGGPARNHPPTSNAARMISVIKTRKGHLLLRRSARPGEAPWLCILPGCGTATGGAYCGGIGCACGIHWAWACGAYWGCGQGEEGGEAGRGGGGLGGYLGCGIGGPIGVGDVW